MSLRRAAGRAALVLGAATTGILAVVAFDRVLGLVLPERWMSRALLFPPDVHFTLRTPEFEYEVRTNEFGFRGGPVAEPRQGRMRIVAIGDSFTYGWGVDISEAWPMVLERALRARGLPVDVLDLGNPGAGPNGYADVVERALPSLKPDLVVVGLLQGDDLMQSSAGGQALLAGNSRSPDRFSRLLTRCFPTLSAVFTAARERRRRSPGNRAWWRELRVAFREGATQARAGFSAAERERYDRLEPEVRSLFESGGLNPALVALAMKVPDYFVSPLEEGTDAAALNQRGLATALTRIRVAAQAAGARVVTVGIPYGFYVSAAAQERMGRLGFTVDKRALVSEAPDRVVAAAAADAGIAFFSPTAAFRREVPLRYFYFPWDNHFTREGHAFFADQVLEYVASALQAGSTEGVRTNATPPAPAGG